tara:strand:+ start:1599 stop:2900 length:1302 start_codon:yes stop_codon:yes gene_type:complete
MINKYEYNQRRESLLKKVHNNSAVFLFSQDVKYRNNDTTFKFRQSSNFFYMTGINNPSVALVMIKRNKSQSSMLLCNRPNSIDRIWTGQLPSKISYKNQYGIDSVIYYDQLESLNINNITNLYYEFTAENKLVQLIRSLNENKSTSRYAKNNSYHSSKNDLSNFIYDMRRIKSKNEILEIKQAAKISSNAHINLMTTCKPGLNEYEIEADFVKTCMSNKCDQAYSAIVASGKNACILHYTNNSSKLKSGELLLVDAAAEYNNYASDITRTIPVSGKFNKYQKIIYNIVLKAQTMAIKSCKPGKTLVDIHDVAVKYITKGLIDASILKGTLKKNIKNESYKKYFMHNTGHWLGLDVHDPCSYVSHGNPVKLKPGMIFTVEPGIYIGKDESLDRGFHNIGVRIEDDILVTKNGYEILSEQVPKNISDIEQLMSND